MLDNEGAAQVGLEHMSARGLACLAQGSREPESCVRRECGNMALRDP